MTEPLFFAPDVRRIPVGKDPMPGFAVEALVARGVFDSLAELDAVMCELDDRRPGARVLACSWDAGMEFRKPVFPAGVCQMGARLGAGSTRPKPVGAPPAPIPAAVWGQKPGMPAALCIFCAWERAAQGPRMARLRINGDVMLWPCARHESRPVTSTQQPAPDSDGAPHPLPAA